MVIFGTDSNVNIYIYPGAMLVICDVNSYRQCVKDFGIPTVSKLFEKLHALCNLLVVVTENLQQVCGGDQLVSGKKLSVLTPLSHHTCNKSATVISL